MAKNWPRLRQRLVKSKVYYGGKLPRLLSFPTQPTGAACTHARTKGKEDKSEMEGNKAFEIDQ